MPRSGFDRIASLYRWGEVLTFGPYLMRCRMTYLQTLQDASNVLILGDGDGRYTAQLLQTHRHMKVVVVDSSHAMLQQIRSRCQADSHRLTLVQSDVTHYTPAQSFDCVISHFLLDCLTPDQMDQLAQQVRLYAPQWILSEFDVPQGHIAWVARLLIRMLYLLFRVLTGLKVHELPPWRSALRAAGYAMQQSQPLLRGILIAELWQQDNS